MLNTKVQHTGNLQVGTALVFVSQRVMLAYRVTLAPPVLATPTMTCNYRKKKVGDFICKIVSWFESVLDLPTALPGSAE